MKGIKQVKNYRLLKEIGKGTTGTVYEAVDDSNGRKYAIKSIASAKLENKRIMDNFKRELKLLHGLNHLNIIKISGIEKTVNNTYLILEYCNGGNLYEYLTFCKQKNNSPLAENEIQFVIRQIINGLEYMHKNKIIHRDIKLENILLNFNSVSNIYIQNQENSKLDYSKLSLFDCTIKIADLGYARELDGSNLASTICGTPMTMAPDVIQFGDRKYNSKADLWSLGAICYELLTGALPFSGNNFNNLIENVMKGKYSFPKTLKISIECVLFINGLLQFYPNKRYDWFQISDHPFIINDTSSFHIIDLEKIDLDNKDCEKFQNDTKDCGNFLWILFKSSLNDISLDKIDSENFKIGEIDAFKKIKNNNKLIIFGKKNSEINIEIKDILVEKERPDMIDEYVVENNVMINKENDRNYRDQAFEKENVDKKISHNEDERKDKDNCSNRIKENLNRNEFIIQIENTEQIEIKEDESKDKDFCLDFTKDIVKTDTQNILNKIEKNDLIILNEDSIQSKKENNNFTFKYDEKSNKDYCIDATKKNENIDNEIRNLDNYKQNNKNTLTTKVIKHNDIIIKNEEKIVITKDIEEKKSDDHVKEEEKKEIKSQLIIFKDENNINIKNEELMNKLKKPKIDEDKILRDGIKLSSLQNLNSFEKENSDIKLKKDLLKNEILTRPEEPLDFNKILSHHFSCVKNESNSELWEIVSSRSITDENIEIINIDKDYNIMQNYFG